MINAKVDISFLKQKNFEANDFFYSDKAITRNIDNYRIDIDSLNNLKNVTAPLAQEIRDIIGFPVYISSGWRCKELNNLITSNKSSKHLNGLAIDIVCNVFGNTKKMVSFLKKSGLNVDVCLSEANHVHVSRIKDANRNIFGEWIDGKFKEI